jgi:hypothetical protein
VKPIRFFDLLQNHIRFTGKILNPLADNLLHSQSHFQPKRSPKTNILGTLQYEEYEKPVTKTKSAKIKKAYIDVAGLEIS